MTNAEIQVGEYVRTKNGSIFKIIGGNFDDYLIDVDYHDLQKMEDDIYDELMWLNYNDNGNFISRIVKNHSSNIIDLIELGDYVNGSLVEAIDYEEDEETGGYYNVLGIWEREDDYCYGIELSKLPIRRIITKEQFKSMEYKVGGENEQM